MNQQLNLTCAVCGEKDFHLKEGYYYCNECGTKSEQVRAFEVERDEDFDGGLKHTNKIKIKSDKPFDKPELTSWECYNYILRGMVEELIELGAKDELKPMVFQIWAAFLRNREVAFFSRRHPELPKLGMRFEKRDAVILYNHAIERKNARREKKENASVASGTVSGRVWRKQMRKFDQSQYESSMSQSQSLYSQSLISQTTFSDTSLNSSGSAPSNRAIQLKFSSAARKQLKKRMPLAHLKKHEKNSSLKCHNMTTKVKELCFKDRSSELNMKLVYAILAVALNLIEDEIQLTDLLRFISEGHISTYNLERFFPLDTSEACKETLKSYRLYYKSTEFAATQLREHCAQIGKAIHLNYFKTPNILKIVQRYTTELCLPDEINTFIERLINLHPPKMDWGSQTNSPCYESRAMAYIIFALKLLFGIDGRKEKQISRSARRINGELATMDLTNYEELFVWDDWVEFIELRKVVLCKHNLSICKQFKQIPPREMYLKNLEERSLGVENSLSKEMLKRQGNFSAVFQHILNVGDTEDKDLETLNFTPSFTPCHNYLKHLKLDPKINLSIPETLNIDHSKRSLIPFLRPTKLKEIFAKCNRKLNVERVACTSKRNFIGVFRNPLLQYLNRNPHKVHLTDDRTPWDIKVEADRPADTIFKQCLDKYNKKSYAQLRKKKRLKMTDDEDINFILKNEFSAGHGSLNFFEEDNMEPGQVQFTQPRRHLERVNLFADLSEDDQEVKQNQEESYCNVSAEAMNESKLKISNFDCWLLMGKAYELNDTQAYELKRTLNLTFFWLLETCALTIRVDWRELYDQLMVLETFFAHAIEPLDNFKDRIIFQNPCEIKDKNKIIHHFQYHW